MHQALLIIDVQPSFDPPQWLIDGIGKLMEACPASLQLNVTTNS